MNTVSNAHSHNDYEQPIPFRMAYQAGFGSVEADIFGGWDFVCGS
jgi:alkaline phosphatase